MSEKKKVKLTEIYIPSNGEMIQTKTVCSGDIFIIPNNTLRLNDIIGNEKLLPCNVWNDKTVPILRTRIEPIKIEEREKLLDALTLEFSEYGAEERYSGRMGESGKKIRIVF